MENHVKKISQEEIEKFINGYDPMERIVNLTYKYQDDFVTIYYRNENDQKCKTKESFYPFVWATLHACRKLCRGNKTELMQLMRQFNIGCKKLSNVAIDGTVRDEFDDGYMFMFFAKSPMSYSTFLNFFKKADNPVYAKKDKDGNEIYDSKLDEKQYLRVTPQEQFMISTGKRFFKGYDDYNQILRMTFDLETTGLNTKKDRIKQLGIKFNRPFYNHPNGFQRIFNLQGTTKEEKDKSELEIIENFFKIIYTFRPDVVCGHNIENFDNQIMIDACTRLGTSIEEISSKYFDGETFHKEPHETVLKLGGEIEKYHQTVCPGTIITDSLHAVRRAQAIDSNMQRADLKYATKYSGIVKPNRVYTPGDKIDQILSDTTNQYAFNDEDGDWYIYDPINGNPVKTIDDFEDDVTTVTFDEFKKDFLSENVFEPISKEDFFDNNENVDITLYEDYLKDAKTEHDIIVSEENILSEYEKKYPLKTKETKYHEYLQSIKGKQGDAPFKMRTRNVLLDGYEIVTGKYIVERYLLDDIWEGDKVEWKFNSTNFLICKMLPVPYKKCTTMGTAGQWKSLLLAWSYEHNLAVPMFRDKVSFTGGLSRLLRTGKIKKQVKLDYNSLYPSIILTWGIGDTNDLMDSMLHFLEYVLTTREKYKAMKKDAEKRIDKYKAKILNGTATEEEILAFNQAQADFALADGKQAQMKVLGNSFFGSYGAPNVFPWGSTKCAEMITCIGRQNLRLMISHFTKLGYEPVVGDSVTGDTPLFIRWKKNNLIDIKPISEIINEAQIKVDNLGREYDYSEKPYEVLCRSGWVDVDYVYRHKTDKDIYRITKEDGSYVDVTRDHSLFTEDKIEIKPTDIKPETKLETSSYNIEPNIDLSQTHYTPHMIENGAISLALGKVDRVHVWAINFPKDKMKQYYDTFILNYRDDIEYSKTCLAGLKYLKSKIR